MEEKEKKGFKSFVPQEYEQDKRRAYASLLQMAEALSSDSSEEGKMEKIEDRTQHIPKRHDQRYHKRRRRKQVTRTTRHERKWIRKERKRLIEAELKAGPHGRLRQALVLRDDADVGHFIEDFKGDLGNVAFEKMLNDDVPLYRRRFSMQEKDSCMATGAEANQNDGWRRWVAPLDTKIANSGEAHDTQSSAAAFIPVAPKHKTPASPQEDYERHLIEKTREFNTRTRDNPYDVQMWLDFAAFQTETADILKSAGVHVSMQSYWEKRLQVLQRALQCNPGSDVLTLEMLRVAEKVKTPEDVNSLWRSALVSAAGSHCSMSLWESFLQRQKQHEHFNAVVASKSYLTALVLFSKECDKEEDLVRLLMDCIRFHLESGFVNMGVVMIQVLLEYNFLYPEEVEDQDLRPCFEKFWKTACPLIGSEHAPGWNRWYRGGGDYRRPTHDVQDGQEEYHDDDNLAREFDDKASKLEDDPSFEDIGKWITMEMSRQSNAVASDDVACSNVTWEDIEPFTVRMRESQSLMTILTESLDYLGLHHIALMQHCSRVFQERSALSLFEVHCERKMFQVRSNQDTALDGFAGAGKKSLHGYVPWWAESSGRQEFAVRLLTDMAGIMEDPLRGILIEMSVKIQLYDSSTESFCDKRPQKTLSYAKMVLSQQYDNILSLWGEYAFLSSLNSNGTSKIANKIFNKCMAQKRSEDDVYYAARLCFSHVKCHLLRLGLQWSTLGSEFMYPAFAAYMSSREAIGAIQIFFWFAGQTEHANMNQAIVQSRMVFQGLIPSCMDSHTSLIALVQTFVAFEILAGIVEDGRPHMDHALSIMHQVTMDLEKRQALQQERPTMEDPISFHTLSVQQCVLAAVTCEVSPLSFSPGEAREMVLHMLEIWPGSPLLMNSLSMLEERFNNLNTLRRELRLLAVQNPMPLHEHLSLISLEGTSAFQRARMVFERALQHQSCRACPLMWRLYMRKAWFESCDSIIDIFFRAIDACPWSKPVWMEGLYIITQCSASPPKAIMETIQALREKDIPWRTEVYETLL